MSLSTEVLPEMKDGVIGAVLVVEEILGVDTVGEAASGEEADGEMSSKIEDLCPLARRLKSGVPSD